MSKRQPVCAIVENAEILGIDSGIDPRVGDLAISFNSFGGDFTMVCLSKERALDLCSRIMNELQDTEIVAREEASIHE